MNEEQKSADLLARIQAPPIEPPEATVSQPNRNSALLWFPKIEAAGLPVPKTEFISYSHGDCVAIFDGEESAEFTRLIAAVRESCERIGYPAFLRTDLSSAKHDGPKAYKITDADSVGRCVGRTLEGNEMKFWMERNGPLAFMVRQFLELPAPFTAFGGLPISREWRFFVESGSVVCAHPYWPAEAIEDYLDSADVIWRPLLAELHEQPALWVELNTMAIEAANACKEHGENWSVDFAQDAAGKWWLLDMAVAEDSYHWLECARASERGREQGK